MLLDGVQGLVEGFLGRKEGWQGKRVWVDVVVWKSENVGGAGEKRRGGKREGNWGIGGRCVSCVEEAVLT